MTEVRVRNASLEDVDEAMLLFDRLNLLERNWRVFAPRPEARIETRERYQRLVAAEDGIVVVAEAEGHLIGLGVGDVTKPSSWSDERALYVTNVYIDPAYRRRGIGRAVVAELVAFAAKRELERLVLRVFTPNHEALDFWTKLGFEPRLIQLTARTDQLKHQTPQPKQSNRGTSQVKRR